MMQRLVSEVTPDLYVKLSVDVVPSLLDSPLKPDEVLMQVFAAPINPSDLGLILPPGTNDTALASCSKLPSPEVGVTYSLDKQYEPAVSNRIGKKLSVGNEGAGVIIKAGSSPEAQKMLNKVVSGRGGRMYAQYRKFNISECILHNEGTTPEEAASSYINPMTVLAMIETMKSEGHNAIIHTAAASNLGLMLIKWCQKCEIPLINIVRKDSQVESLKAVGAKYVINSSSKDFMAQLISAVSETKATLCFDAIGGGSLSGKILTAMEIAAQKFDKDYVPGPYGTSVLKQVYIYGGLDRSATVINRSFGLTFSIGGWLMPNVLAKMSRNKIKELEQTVADNIKTVFKSEYYKRVSLNEVVDVENFKECVKQETGKKFLVLPNKKTQNL